MALNTQVIPNLIALCFKYVSTSLTHTQILHTYISVHKCAHMYTQF